jgi:hypothetical protein
MHVTIILSLLAAGVHAEPPRPTQPTMSPNHGYGALHNGLLANMGSQQAKWDRWGGGWIPEVCKRQATIHKLSPWDFTVFNVHYDDCGDAWIMCRHKDAEWSEWKMADHFGRLPMRMRQHVRHLLALPAYAAPNIGGKAYDSVIDMIGNIHPMAVLVHEVGHVLDFHAYDRSFGIPFSSSNTWVTNQQMDKRVIENYARTNQRECLAGQTTVAMYDKVVPGGIGTLYPDSNNGWGGIFHQYATVRGYLGNTMDQGGWCSSRPANSNAVAMGNSRRGILSDKPDVSFKSNITIVPDLPHAGKLAMSTPIKAFVGNES